MYLEDKWPQDIESPQLYNGVMETLSASLAICNGNPTVIDGFPSQTASDAWYVHCKPCYDSGKFEVNNITYVIYSQNHTHQKVTFLDIDKIIAQEK